VNLSRLLPALTLSALLAQTASAGEVQAAVAANFAGPMQRIAAAFEQQTGHTVRLAFASSGKLYAQIRAGAPFDVFLSADEDKPQRLETDGLAESGSRFVYAEGKLALWSTQTGLVDEHGTVLHSKRYTRLAMADPKLAPYGRAAQQVLEKLGLWHEVQGKLTLGENIGQTFQFAATGNAELGLIALSQIMRDGKVESGSWWAVPDTYYQPIRQSAVLLAAARDKPAARALLAYLKSDAARHIILSYGYGLP